MPQGREPGLRTAGASIGSATLLLTQLGFVQMQALQAAIKYDQDDLAGAKVMLSSCPQEDVSTVVNWGCVLFKVSDTLLKLPT